MNSNPAKTFTRGKWAALFLALLIVPEFAFAQTPPKKTNQSPPTTPKSGPPKTELPGGGSRETRPNGDTIDRDKSGHPSSVTTHTGVTAKFSPGGKVSSVKFKSSTGYNTKVSRGANGSRIVVSEHLNDRGERITTVNTGPNRGYVDHTFTRNGQPYLRRTYVAGGKSYAVVYRGYYYGGRPYFAYVPGYYYAPGFYGWAYAPWGVPVAFEWGWGGVPWYGYSAYYFTPYAAYPGPAAWLTDYVVAENLQAGYGSSTPPDGGGSSMPPAQNMRAVYQVNCGGQAVGSFSADKYFTGGSVFTTADGVAAPDVSHAPPDEVYQSERFGNIAYHFPDLTPGAQYIVRLHFAEIAWNSDAVGNRVFNVLINSKELLHNFDVLAETRAKDRAIAETFTVNASDDGRISVVLQSVRDWPTISAIEVFQPESAVVSPRSPGEPTGGTATNTSNANLTPEVKAAISDEVKTELASEQVASSPSSTAPTSDVPAALDPKQRTFIVSSALSEQLTDGASCSLSAGDIVTRVTDTPDPNQKVTALVTSSQKNDCASGSMLSISLQELQDMHNDFAQKLDAGLQKLADNEGKNGIPAGPAAGRRANPDGQAQPDITAAADLQQQQKDADAAEKDVQQAATGQGN